MKGNLTGRVFGFWEVIGPSEKPYYYTCRCLKCGTVKSVYKSTLLLGKSSMCLKCAKSGPRPGKTAAFIKAAQERYLGQVVNGWKVLDILPPSKSGESLRCRVICPVCGKETITSIKRLSHITRCAACNRDIKKKSEAIHSTAWADGSSLASVKSRMSGATNRNSTTGANGVSRLTDGRYKAYINFKRRQVFLGKFSSLEDAVAARKAAEQLIYGEYLDQHAGWEEELKEKLKELKDKK